MDCQVGKETNISGPFVHGNKTSGLLAIMFRKASVMKLHASREALWSETHYSKIRRPVNSRREKGPGATGKIRRSGNDKCERSRNINRSLIKSERGFLHRWSIVRPEGLASSCETRPFPRRTRNGRLIIRPYHFRNRKPGANDPRIYRRSVTRLSLRSRCLLNPISQTFLRSNASGRKIIDDPASTHLQAVVTRRLVLGIPENRGA